MKKKILMMAAGFSIAVVLSEIILRLLGISYPNFFIPDPIVGISHCPGVEGRYEMEGKSYVTINSDGLRDIEHAKEKPPGTIRIAVLGDSFAEALQVELEDTFWAIMERELRKLLGREVNSVEAINFGTSAHGTAQELLTLRHRVWDYSPDMVLLAFSTANDIADNSCVLKQREYIPYFIYQGDSLVLDRSFLRSRPYRFRQNMAGKLYYGLANRSRIMQLINILRFRFKRAGRKNGEDNFLEQGLYEEVYLPPRDEIWKNAWRVTEGLILKMKEEVEARGADFFLVLLSSAMQTHPDPSLRRSFRKKIGSPDLFYPNRRLRAFAEKNGIHVLSLAEDFQKYAEKEEVYLHGFGSRLGRGHWNETAHRLAGKKLAAWLHSCFEEMKLQISESESEWEEKFEVGN